MKTHLARLLCVAACACGGQTAEELPPIGQIVLHIDTDVPVPAAPGTREAADAPPWLFDRLRIEVLRAGQIVPGAVSLADRDFAVHRGRFAAGPVSVGLVPPTGDATLVARVRLFRADHARGGEPTRSATIEATVALPAVAAEGKIDVHLRLRGDDVGKPRGATTPVPSEGPLGASQVGKWARALPSPCPGTPGPGEVCIPGGAFWMGDPDVRGVPNIADTHEERLVVMPPFYLDQAEVTVAEMRERLPALVSAGAVAPPSWAGDGDPSNLDAFATYTPGPSPADPADARAKLPVNGVVWATARAYCASVGKVLPSEAMFEFVASGRGAERRFPWGDDEPRCDDAVFARAGVGVYFAYSGTCRDPSTIGRPAEPGSALRDRVLVRDGSRQGVVLDLAGNLTEWTGDAWRESTEPPWSTPGYLVDPVAEPSGAEGEVISVRGGSWRGVLAELLAGARSYRDPAIDNRSIGFRCARRQ